MARTAPDAIAWARGQVTDPDKSYYRLCLQFVRMAFGLSAVFPDAGTAWDQAKKKHKTTDPLKVPRGVPVFWELPTAADHVALSLGDGKCISNDVVTKGRINVVTIDSITRNWNGKLLGWTEDLNGQTVYTPPARRTPNITKALNARTNAQRIEALNDVSENGSKMAAKHAQAWIDAIQTIQQAKARADKAREALKKLERA